MVQKWVDEGIEEMEKKMERGLNTKEHKHWQELIRCKILRDRELFCLQCFGNLTPFQKKKSRGLCKECIGW